MTSPWNARYERRYVKPADRPSNTWSGRDRFVDATRERVQQLARDLDDETIRQGLAKLMPLVIEAQQAEVDRVEQLARWETTLDLRDRRRFGDPGE